jgi:hypothetical protein
MKMQMPSDPCEDGVFLTFLVAARFIRESLCASGGFKVRVVGIKKMEGGGVG